MYDQWRADLLARHLFNISTYNLNSNAGGDGLPMQARYAMRNRQAMRATVVSLTCMLRPRLLVFLSVAAHKPRGVLSTPRRRSGSCGADRIRSITVIPVGYAHPNETTTGEA